MPITAERFATGMTFPEYVAQMGENRDRFLQTAAAFDLAPEDQARICAIAAPLNVLIITEDWCGDALTYLPVLARVTACAPHWNVRIFYRDANPDLADQYLNGGQWRSVPVVVFYDAAMRELGRFIERPASVNRERQQVIDAVAREHAEVAPGLRYNDQSDAGKALLAGPLRELRLTRQAAWEQAAIDEVCSALANVRAAA
jgi:hypothetical protein